MITLKEAESSPSVAQSSNRLPSIPGVEERRADGRVASWKQFYYDRWWMPVGGRYAFPIEDRFDRALMELEQCYEVVYKQEPVWNYWS